MNSREERSKLTIKKNKKPIFLYFTDVKFDIRIAIYQTEAERFKQLKLEKRNNEEALAQRTIEQRKASIEAQIETEKLKLREKASKLRSAKALPKKCFGFCGE